MRRTALASGDGKIQLLIGIDTYRIPLAEARINATLPSANSFNIIGSSSQRLDNTTYSGGWPPVWVVTPIATIIEGGYLTLPGILSLYALFQADAGAASEFFECKFLARVR